MTPEELDMIEERLLAAMPQEKYAAGRIGMNWTPECFKEGDAQAKVWYDDGDLCAVVHGNLALGFDGDAVSYFFSRAMQDVAALIKAVREAEKTGKSS